MARSITISIEPKAGQIHQITINVADRVVLDEDGTDKRTWTSNDVPDAPVHVKVFVTGVPGSQYILAVDVEDKVRNFALKYTLAGTTHVTEFDV